MNKKGFSSVEYQILLLLIEALAVGVIPNLGNNNDIKLNDFINKTQSLMDDAKTDFINSSLDSNLENYVFESNINNEDERLEINYYIKLDSNGNFTDVVVWDENYCYEAVLGKDKDLDGKIDIDYLAKPKQFNIIDKTIIKENDILKHHEEDSKENYCKSNEYVK